jgi:methionyl-tRNA formyltransferase
LRTAYLGTSAFAAEVLRTLAESKHRPLLVLTPPDRRAGRGRRLSSPPAADAARELGIELHQSADLNDDASAARLREARPEVVAVCAFGQLIREPVLSEHPFLNVHPSLIPRWRGAAPIERAIIAGDERSGVTIMRVTEGLDSGPIALQEAVAIEPDDTYETLSARLAELGSRVLIDAIDRCAAGTLEFTEQDESAATYAEKILPPERRLDPARTAVELERVVRALNPHIGTYLELEGGSRLGVRAGRVAEPGPKPGEILLVDDELRLGCGAGSLELEVVQAAGGKALRASDYVRGHEVPGRAV